MRFDYTNPGRQAAISMLALIALLIGRGLRGSDAQPERPTAAAHTSPAAITRE